MSNTSDSFVVPWVLADGPAKDRVLQLPQSIESLRLWGPETAHEDPVDPNTLPLGSSVLYARKVAFIDRENGWRDLYYVGVCAAATSVQDIVQAILSSGMQPFAKTHGACEITLDMTEDPSNLAVVASTDGVFQLQVPKEQELLKWVPKGQQVVRAMARVTLRDGSGEIGIDRLCN